MSTGVDGRSVAALKLCFSPGLLRGDSDAESLRLFVVQPEPPVKSISDLVSRIRSKYNVVAPFRLTKDGYTMSSEDPVASLLRNADEIAVVGIDGAVLLPPDGGKCKGCKTTERDAFSQSQWRKRGTGEARCEQCKKSHQPSVEEGTMEAHAGGHGAYENSDDELEASVATDSNDDAAGVESFTAVGQRKRRCKECGTRRILYVKKGEEERGRFCQPCWESWLDYREDSEGDQGEETPESQEEEDEQSASVSGSSVTVSDSTCSDEDEALRRDEEDAAMQIRKVVELKAEYRKLRREKREAHRKRRQRVECRELKHTDYAQFRCRHSAPEGWCQCDISLELTTDSEDTQDEEEAESGDSSATEE